MPSDSLSARQRVLKKRLDAKKHKHPDVESKKDEMDPNDEKEPKGQ